ncbi:hypothetical protein F183_A54360 [Bryobacterales bacterium F-183]|nr:hypothetical protein F183_A54360 [Bryobacterales bacterium F-183]
MNRRLFLKSSALAMFGVGASPLWLSKAAAAATNNNGARKKVLIAIFQRGAVDGLNMVVPHGEARYYELRPTIAIKNPLDLDGMFGLHPSLEPLMTPWKDGKLAIVNAAGSPDPTRSHFDAQDYMESGTPGVKSTPDGWLNRALPGGKPPSPVRAVSLGPSLPRTMRGAREAVAISNLKDFRIANAKDSESFESMYASTMDKMLAGTSKDTFDAVRAVQNVERSVYTPANNARYPDTRFGNSMKQIARLIKADAGLEVAFADMGGWDTHVNEVPQLSNLLRDFGGTLGAFYTDMGDRMADITIVTMSEFGRTARENGTRGTDHGHANAMLVIGGNVKGGKVYGDWPGLGKDQLYEGRDLAITTDFRDVLSEAVAKQLGVRNSVFPGYQQPKYRNLLIG